MRAFLLLETIRRLTGSGVDRRQIVHLYASRMTACIHCELATTTSSFRHLLSREIATGLRGRCLL